MPNLYESLCERLEGRKYSNYFAAFCPWDTHATPALLVYDDGMVKCLSCNKYWNHQQLDGKLGSFYIPTQRNDTVSRILPQWRKWEDRYGDLEGIVHTAHKYLINNPPFQTYFKRRKIYEYAEQGSLGYLDGWVVFPVFDAKHRLVDTVVRSVKSEGIVRYVVHPNSSNSRPLYSPSWDAVLRSDTLYVVYGIIDSISLHLAGLPAVTGLTGKSLAAESLLPLKKRFVIVPDDGEEKEAHLLVNKLGWRAKVKKISWPDGCKDSDDLRRKFGNDFLLNALGA